jgi:hypothetical protein
VRAQVPNKTGAGMRLFFPGVWINLRPVSVEMRFQINPVAKARIGQDCLKGEEIGIPATVLECSEYFLLF